ncbi:MAG: hypothetical protein ACRELB_10245, partial [Polyangiaceae bacterium]
MLDFEPLVARLVEDVLCAIGRATLSELAELRGPPTRGEPAKFGRKGGGRPSKPRREAGRAARPSPTPPPKKRAAPKRRRAAEPLAVLAEPPGPAIITDPERLLAAAPTSPTAGPPSASGPDTRAHAPPLDEPSPQSPPPVEPPPRAATV